MKLRTLGLLGLGTLGLLSLSGCKKEEAPSSGATPAAAEPEVLSSDDTEAQPVKGGGTIRGAIAFKGKPPAPKPIEPGSDPICDGMNLVDEAVVVKDGKLANVLVRVQGDVPGKPAVPPSEMVVIDQNRCTYKPRVQGAVQGQRMVLMNSDETLHNVRGVSGTKTLFNVNQPPLKTKEANAPKDADLIRLKCDIHPWMTAWVVMSSNPYFTTSGEDGAFTLQGVPEGTYTLEAWHEVFGTRTAQVTVKEGQEAQVAFEFSP
jgi:Carboxypeptidase regulatory-like domain